MLNEEKVTSILTVEKFNALNKFIQDYIKDPNVAGILLTGSHVHGDAGPNADLDIFIVYNDLDKRTRGNLFINGFEIEYFINPISRIEKYFIEEYPKKINTAHMFANGIIIYENGTELSRLVGIAKEFLVKKLPDFKDYELYICRYMLDDSRKDLLDALEYNDIETFELIAGDTVIGLIINFGKIKKFYPAKPKRLLKQLFEIDSTFASKLQQYLICNGTIHQKFELLDDCISYIESLVGGPRPKSFSFTTLSGE